jgi:hypothetical protein
MKGRKYSDKKGGRLGQYLGVCLVCLGVFLTSKAQAGCAPGQEPFTSCQIEGRDTEVFVCFDDNVATYSYGPIGGSPELFLSETIAQVDFQPWSGLGTAISEASPARLRLIPTVMRGSHDPGWFAAQRGGEPCQPPDE